MPRAPQGTQGACVCTTASSPCFGWVSSCHTESHPLNKSLAPPGTGTRYRNSFDPAGCLVAQSVTNGKILLGLQAPVLVPSLHPTQISALRGKVRVSGSKRHILASKKSCKSELQCCGLWQLYMNLLLLMFGGGFKLSS